MVLSLGGLQPNNLKVNIELALQTSCVLEPEESTRIKKCFYEKNSKIKIWRTFETTQFQLKEQIVPNTVRLEE